MYTPKYFSLLRWAVKHFLQFVITNWVCCSPVSKVAFFCTHWSGKWKLCNLCSTNDMHVALWKIAWREFPFHPLKPRLLVFTHFARSATVLFIFRFALHFNADVMTLKCHSPAHKFSDRLCTVLRQFFTVNCFVLTAIAPPPVSWRAVQAARWLRFRSAGHSVDEAGAVPMSAQIFGQNTRWHDVLIGTFTTLDTNVTIISCAIAEKFTQCGMAEWERLTQSPQTKFSRSSTTWISTPQSRKVS